MSLPLARISVILAGFSAVPKWVAYGGKPSGIASISAIQAANSISLEACRPAPGCRRRLGGSSAGQSLAKGAFQLFEMWYQRIAVSLLSGLAALPRSDRSAGIASEQPEELPSQLSSPWQVPLGGDLVGDDRGERQPLGSGEVGGRHGFPMVLRKGKCTSAQRRCAITDFNPYGVDFACASRLSTG